MFILLNVRSISKKWGLFYLSIFFLIIIFGLASFLIVQYINSDNFVPKGINVNGIPFGGLNMEEARDKLIAMSGIQARWPKDAFYELGSLKEEKNGRLIAINQTLERIHNSPVNSNISPIYYNVFSFYNSNDFNEIKYGKGTDKEFHYLTDQELKELKSLSNKLFDNIIYPGETLSLADFWQSNTVTNQKISPNVSQLVARALYNTANKAKLEIVEAWVVKQPKIGSLYEENIDFQLGKDLKIRNSSTFPILIRGEIDKESLKLWLLGS